MAEQDWKDDGSLPLDSHEQLPFYLIDAHEEQANSGLLYLFGKVRAQHVPLVFSHVKLSVCGHLLPNSIHVAHKRGLLFFPGFIAINNAIA